MQFGYQRKHVNNEMSLCLILINIILIELLTFIYQLHISYLYSSEYLTFHFICGGGGGWGGIFFLRTYFEKKVIPRFGMKHIGGVTKYVSV